MIRKVATIASLPAFLLAAYFVPWDRLPGICVLHRATGLPCPTCGMTRSVAALTHLDFARAFKLNPLAPALIGLIGLWWVIAVYESLSGRRTRITRWAGRRANLLTLLAAFLLIAFGALRIALLLH